MNFEFYTASKIVFGEGVFEKVGYLVSGYGKRLLVVYGGTSMERSGVIARLEEQMKSHGVSFHHYSGITQEPNPEMVDKGVEQARENQCDAVIAIGGGSVIDTGKAIAGLIPNDGSIIDYLEGVGREKKLEKDPVPFIAIPTTSGTGSEVTKNAVITSKQMGFKKSFRSEKLIPDIAVVDPSLTVSLPPRQTASSGMDALTQLIESYVSKKAKPIPEALAIYGIELAAKSLERAYSDGSDMEARENMAMASLLSGICLANSGLGAAHGIAAALGCHFGIPHGLACAILLPHVMEYNMESQLNKFATIGRVLNRSTFSHDREGARAGIEYIYNLAKAINIPPDLKDYGILEEDLPKLAQSSRGSSMSGNPIEMSDEDIIGFLKRLI